MMTERGSRRGWRETIEPGLYRSHRVHCPSSDDRRTGRRCRCPFQVKVPGVEPGSTRMVTVAGSVSEARAERRRLLAAGRPDTQAAEPVRRVLHDLARDWFSAGEPRWSPGTLALREHAYRQRIAPRFADARLVDLTRVAIEAWAAELIAAGHGRRAVEIAVQTLRAMLSVAMDAGMVAANPAARVRLPPAPPPERTPADRVVDLAGAERLRAACHSARQETIIRAMVEGGLRRGEVCGLAWPDVRLDERRIIVRQAVYQNAAVGKIVRSTKTARVGRVPISDEFVERLKDWHAESVGRAGADASGFVWPGRDGGPMSPSSVTHLVAKVGKRAGLVDAKGRHVAHGHGLRHSAGSIALSEGVPLTVVAATLRHSRPSFTAQRYSHLLGDAELDRFASAHSTRTVRETVRGNRKDGENPTK